MKNIPNIFINHISSLSPTSFAPLRPRLAPLPPIPYQTFGPKCCPLGNTF